MPTFHSNRFGYVHFCLYLVVFRICLVSAMSIIVCWDSLIFRFSAVPFFRLCPLGYAHCNFRPCPLFFWSHFSAMPFVRLRPLFFLLAFRLCHFPAMPATVFIVFYFPAPVSQSLRCDWRWGATYIPNGVWAIYFRQLLSIIFKRASDV